MAVVRLHARLERHRAAILKLLKPRVVFTLTAAEGLTPWASQLGSGGHPYLRIDHDWPRDRVTGRALVMVAQINFAEVPPLPGFPERGLLQVFIADEWDHGPGGHRRGMMETALDDQTHFRVLFHAEPTMDLSELYARDDFDFFPDGSSIERVAHGMSFARVDQPMPDDDARFDRLPAGARELILYDIPVRKLYLEHMRPHDQIGGYHYSQQGWDPRRPYMEPDESELLLQIDGCGPISWGDLGTACFFVRRADLAARRFDRVLYYWDCT